MEPQMLPDEFNVDFERAVYAHHHPHQQRGGVGMFCELMAQTTNTYNPEKHGGGVNRTHPKCVTFGDFRGIANTPEHEALLKAMHEPKPAESSSEEEFPVEIVSDAESAVEHFSQPLAPALDPAARRPGRPPKILTAPQE